MAAPGRGSPGAAVAAADSSAWTAVDGVNFTTETAITNFVVGSNALDSHAIYGNSTTFTIVDGVGLSGTGNASGLNLAHVDIGSLGSSITTYGQVACVLQATELADLWFLWGMGGRNTPWYTLANMNGIQYESGVFPGTHRAAGIRAGTLTGYLAAFTKTVAPTAVCIQYNGGGSFGGKVTYSEKAFDYDLDPGDMEHSLGSIVGEGKEDYNGQANATGQLFTQQATKYDRVNVQYRKGNLENAVIKSVRWFGRTLTNP